MSNKLYTEAEVRKVLYELFIFKKNADLRLKELTPIELPSDEEIEEFAHTKYMEVEDSRWFEPLKEGAKWMKSKIQGGNNEQ